MSFGDFSHEFRGFLRIFTGFDVVFAGFYSGLNNSGFISNAWTADLSTLRAAQYLQKIIKNILTGIFSKFIVSILNP